MSDQLLCKKCGKSFPIGLEGQRLFRAHELAEEAIDSAADHVIASTPAGAGDGDAPLKKNSLPSGSDWSLS